MKKCVCGCSDVVPDSLKAFHTHQVIELPEIKMDVVHFILHKGVCSKCGQVVKAKIPSEHQTGYGPRLSALIAEISGIQGNSRETVRTFCRSVLNFSIKHVVKNSNPDVIWLFVLTILHKGHSIFKIFG